MFRTLQNAFATKQRQKRCSIVSLFWLQKEHSEVSDIPRENREQHWEVTFHLNKAHYLKPYIGGSVYTDQEVTMRGRI